MRKFLDWLKNLKQKFGWATILIPVALLVLGTGLTLWGLYMSGFDILAWLKSPQFVPLAFILGIVLVFLIGVWSAC